MLFGPFPVSDAGPFFRVRRAEDKLMQRMDHL